MSTPERAALPELLRGVDEVECVTPDLNGVPRGKVMTVEGFYRGGACSWLAGCCCSASWAGIRLRVSTAVMMAIWP